jgi:hypothetical protein
MRRELTLFMAAVAFLVVTPAKAQTVRSYIYVTVDAVEWDSTRSLTITGILNGQASQTTETVFFSFFSGSSNDAQYFKVETCVRMALLAMNKPGQFVFELVDRGGGSVKCKLTRATP